MTPGVGSSLTLVHSRILVQGLRAGREDGSGESTHAPRLSDDSSQFATAAQVGTLFSGVMQGAIIQTLEGKAGLSGWQWLFVIDFLITVPIAAYGLLMFPDTPHTVKACKCDPPLSANSPDHIQSGCRRTRGSSASIDCRPGNTCK